jgi:hypothetical protein
MILEIADIQVHDGKLPGTLWKTTRSDSENRLLLRSGERSSASSWRARLMSSILHWQVR